ncbi:cytochrome-c peroxidase [bacterium SCSIO 12741]|nr:cytochrome-c peroxidase [bacterium SCSIO 12741]
MKLTNTFPTTTALIAVAFITLFSCQKEEATPTAEVTESSVPLVENTFRVSPVEYLGRVLFYDKALSRNGAISCGSCHSQSLAFSDFRTVSTGFERVKGERNTPPIQNLRNSEILFWDGRRTSLEDLALDPIFNHVEMGLISEKELIQIIRSKPYYQDLFRRAFESDLISSERIAQAIAAFLAQLESTGSKFDQMGFIGLSPDEQEGMRLFFGKYNCGNCHNLFNPAGYSVDFFLPAPWKTINQDLLLQDQIWPILDWLTMEMLDAKP